MPKTKLANVSQGRADVVHDRRPIGFVEQGRMHHNRLVWKAYDLYGYYVSWGCKRAHAVSALVAYAVAKSRD